MNKRIGHYNMSLSDIELRALEEHLRQTVPDMERGPEKAALSRVYDQARQVRERIDATRKR